MLSPDISRWLEAFQRLKRHSSYTNPLDAAFRPAPTCFDPLEPEDPTLKTMWASALDTLTI
jgi:hypothetical protein